MFKSTLPGKIQPPKNQEEVRNWLGVGQVNQSYYYDRHTRELPKLHRDQAADAQDPVRNTWNPVRVIDQDDTTRSYIFETETGAQLRRNRIHLRPNNAPNNRTNNLPSLTRRGSTMSQYSSASSQELTPADYLANNLSSSNLITRPSSANPQCSTLAETEKGSEENLARDVKSEHGKDLISDPGFISSYEYDIRTLDSKSYIFQ